MTETIVDRVQRYILDGDDTDLRRLLGVAQGCREMARSASRRVGVQRRWTVIDCGCGPIGGLAVLAELVGPSGRVVGVDSGSPRMAAASNHLAPPVQRTTHRRRSSPRRPPQSQQEHPASDMGPGYAATCTLPAAGVAIQVT